MDACDPFVVAFVIVVDDDLRTADDGRDGGLSFFCGLAVSLPMKIENGFEIVVFFNHLI